MKNSLLLQSSITQSGTVPIGPSTHAQWRPAGIALAQEDAKKPNHTYVGTEHLLLEKLADLDMVVHKPCVCLLLQRPLTTPH